MSFPHIFLDYLPINNKKKIKHRCCLFGRRKRDTTALQQQVGEANGSSRRPAAVASQNSMGEMGPLRVKRWWQIALPIAGWGAKNWHPRGYGSWKSIFGGR